jgi:hypothetical protein
MTTSYRELVGSYLDLKWQLDPVAATAAGVGTHDARLGRFTRADVKGLVAAFRAVGGAFEELEPDDLQDEVDVTAVLGDIRHTAYWLEHERPHERNPEFHVTHLLGGLHTLLIRQDQPVEHRAAALAGRLRDIPRFLEDARVTLHRPALVFTETAHAVARAGRSLLREVIPQFAARLPRGPMEEIEHGLIAARSAYDDFLEFLAVHLRSKSDGDFAIGREAFDHRLHFEHALRETAPELLRYGEQLVRETEAELAALAEALAPGTPWRALADRLRADHPPPDAVVVAYAGQMERCPRERWRWSRRRRSSGRWCRSRRTIRRGPSVRCARAGSTSPRPTARRCATTAGTSWPVRRCTRGIRGTTSSSWWRRRSRRRCAAWCSRRSRWRAGRSTARS